LMMPFTTGFAARRMAGNTNGATSPTRRLGAKNLAVPLRPELNDRRETEVGRTSAPPPWS